MVDPYAPNTYIFSNWYTTGNPFPNDIAPDTELLDGRLILKADALTFRGGFSPQTSMLPQNPSNIAAQPEMTFFTIVKCNAHGGTQGLIWELFGGAGNTLVMFAISAAGTLRFFTRSINGQVAQVFDTVSVDTDPNYYLVCVQYSFATKTARIIVNGRDNTAINLLQDDFSFDEPGSNAGFLLNVRENLVLEPFLGSTGEILWYDIALLSNAQINQLANSYYLKKYPSLVWTNI